MIFSAHCSRLTAHAGAAAAALLLFIAVCPAPASAHAFPLRAEPRVGSKVADAPEKVTIWFDGGLEPAFSAITVTNSAKQRVDKNNSRVSRANPNVMEVDLPPLPPGRYQVHWTALSVDTHVTEGQFTFTVEGR